MDSSGLPDETAQTFDRQAGRVHKSANHMKIYFARHGESLANTLHIISNHDLPHPLTDQGRTQAQALATRLTGIPLARIYASPVIRARETAEIVGAALGVPVEVTEALKEYDCGSLEGRGDAAAWEIHQQFVGDWCEGRNRDQAPAGGETFFDIQKRVGEFVRGLANQYNGTQAQILCVSHGGTLLFGLPGLLSNVEIQFARKQGFGYADIVCAEWLEGRFICRSWGNVTLSY